VPGPEVLLGGAGGHCGEELRPPQGLDIFKVLATQIPTLRRVPIVASSTCARALTCLLQAVEREKTWEALARLLLFPRIALAAPARGGNATRSSPTQQCRLNFLSSVLDPQEELVARLRRASPADGPRTRARTRAAAAEAPDDSSPASDRTAAAVRALLAEGAPDRALQLLTSDGVCVSADQAVLARLWKLHPQADLPGLVDPLPKDRPYVTPLWATDQLLAMEAVVRSFPPDSAAGPSGLRPQNLLDCLNSADSAAKTGLLSALLTLVTTVSAGRFHPRAAPYLRTARLIPLTKNDGGVRPIAVDDTLRRLTANWMLKNSQGRSATAAFAHLQTAFAKGRPCEVVAMGVQALADTLHGSTGWLLLQVDLNNAFNSIHRPAILDALEQRCPSPSSPRLCSWAARSYGRPGGCSKATPWALSSSPRASRQPWTPCHQVGPSTHDTWMTGFSWVR